MLVTVNCLLAASPSPQSHLTSMLQSFNSCSSSFKMNDQSEGDLILSSGSFSVNIHPSILCSLSPLLSSLIFPSSNPTTLILPQLSPGSLPLTRELLFTGQCKGTLVQLEDAVQLLGLLGIQIRNEVGGSCEVGGQAHEVSFILGGCDSTDNTANEFVDESLSVKDIPDETYNNEQFASIIVGDQTCLEALNLSDIQIESIPSLKNETKKKSGMLPNDDQFEDKCEYMEYVDLSEEEVEISSTTALKSKVFPCDQCEYVATQKGHLKRHVFAKHSLERVECKTCEKKFTLKESLRRHVKEVHGKETFSCPECDFVGRRQDSLNYHMQWKHSEEKSTCDECDYQAETMRLIKKHKLKVHRGVKYPCDKCDYVSVDKSSLYYHMKAIHEKIRFQCVICTRKFTKHTSLKTHLISIHKFTMN